MAMKYKEGDWVRINGSLAHIYATWEDTKKYAKQYFEVIPDCPNQCLEGDGGYVGANEDMMSLAKPPFLRYCPHCDEETYGYKDI